MSKEETKQLLLNQIDLDQMMEDLCYHTAYYNKLTEDQALEILDNLYDKYDIPNVFYQSFKDEFKRQDSIKKYCELQAKAIRSQDSFLTWLDKVMVDELNEQLPSDEQIEAEKFH